MAALSFTPGSIVGASTALLRESRCPDPLPGADLRARSETGMEREWCREQVETRKGAGWGWALRLSSLRKPTALGSPFTHSVWLVPLGTDGQNGQRADSEAGLLASNLHSITYWPCDNKLIRCSPCALFPPFVQLTKSFHQKLLSTQYMSNTVLDMKRVVKIKQ